jgi:hypothetical protein
MIWDVEWSEAAEKQLLALRRWQDAERVATAVYRYAATGDGGIQKVTEIRLGFALAIEPFVALCSFEPSVRAIRVWAVFRKR